MLEPDYGGYEWCSGTSVRKGTPCKQKGWVPDIDQPYWCPSHRPAD